MERIDTKTFISFAALDSLYWAFYAAFVGFTSTYLLACGMTNSVLSIMLACFMGCSFIGAFFWGSVCDKAKTNKKIFIPEFIVTNIVAFIIYFMADKNMMVSTILYPVFGFLSAPLGSNIDTWMLRSFHKDASTYGRARAIGSVGYAITALIIGNLINMIGYQMIPIGFIFFAVLVLMVAFWIKEVPFETVVAQSSSGNPKELLHIGPYIFMLIVVFFTGLAISPVNNLKPTILQSVGGDVSILGLDSFLGVMVQAVFIFTSGKLKKIPVYVRLFLMTVTVFITMCLVSFAVSPWMIILGTIFSNTSYGIMLPTQREIVEANVPSTLKNTAHSLSDAMYGSFSGILALTYSGFVMDAFGARSVGILGGAIMIVAMILALTKVRKKTN